MHLKRFSLKWRVAKKRKSAHNPENQSSLTFMNLVKVIRVIGAKRLKRPMSAASTA